MASLLDLLMGRRDDFYPFEICIIEAVKSHLDDVGASRLQHQVEAINKIQRLVDGKEVNLYQMHHGKPAFDDNLCFPSMVDEALLATVTLTRPDKRTKLKVDIWLVMGRLFSLAFNKPPKQFFAGENLRSLQPEIAEVKIWFDPMHPHTVETGKPIDESMLLGWLREWHCKRKIDNLHAPLSQSDRSAYLDRIDAQMPLDYLELVAQTEGVRIDTFEVYGAGGIRQIVWSEANYYILAEIEGCGVLAVKDGDRNGELYFLNYEDNDTRAVGTSLQKAIADLQAR